LVGAGGNAHFRATGQEVIVAARFENRTWGGLALRGVVAVLFGILAFARPGMTAVGLVYLFGAYVLFDGIFAIAASVDVAQLKGRWWPLLLVGIVGIVIGVIAFTNPRAMAAGLIYYIAFWAIFTGILEVAGAIRLRSVVEGEWRLAVAGLLAIAFGILVAARPGAGLLSLLWLMGAFAIIFGVLEIGLAFRLRGVQQRLAAS
jgi:uncharacterized membrane protein HdeD (DUF308 family)